MTLPAIVTGFREGLGRGELLIQKCGSCSKLNMYPRHACPYCQSSDLGWQPAAGTGTLMSVTVLRAGAPVGFEHDLPYALGIVRLDEDVQLLARLAPDEDGDWSSYHCDDKVSFRANHPSANDRPCAAFGHADTK